VESLDTPARALVRAPESDMFRLGSDEAHAQGFAEGYEQGLADARRGPRASVRPSRVRVRRRTR
jgi:coenzyme F420-0:L-glutamate ligase/coenzyme F420-1:gamma-L-glutamate ligase